MNSNALGIMYLAEETSPDYAISDYKVDKIVDCFFVEFEACLHSFDVMNRNKRMYALENVRDCINNSEEIQSDLKKNGWYGEMDHPSQDYENAKLTSQRVMKIDMGNRSHKIMNPFFKNNCLYATIQTSSGTDAGTGMAKEIIQGLVPSFSCRSIATMENRNGKPYVNVKNIRTYDWVLYPSHREAYKSGKAELKTGSKQVVALESVMPKELLTFDFKPFEEKYSSDQCIDLSEFCDFNTKISNNDRNINMVLESFGLSPRDIVSYDRTGRAKIIDHNNTIYVNTDIDTKRKIDDFLMSF
jgi:hypothetical protein